MARPPFRLGIRAKLLLVLTVFLAIPWLGYAYVQEVERVLREAQQRTLAGTAQAVATALHDRPALFARPLGSDGAGGGEAAGAAEIEAILQGLSRTTARIFVVDRQSNVIARVGSLQRPEPAETPPPQGPRAWRRGSNAMSCTRCTRCCSRSRPRTSATTSSGARCRSRRRSTARLPASSPLTGARRGTVGSASSPRRIRCGRRFGRRRRRRRGDHQRGAGTAQPRVRAAVHAGARADARGGDGAHRLRLAPVVAIRRLRDEVEQAIDAKGVCGASPRIDGRRRDRRPSRSFTSVLSRLADAVSHREALASRLSHELVNSTHRRNTS